MTTETKPTDIINLSAFKAGYSAFFKGTRKPMVFTAVQENDVKRRNSYLIKGRADKANVITDKLTTYYGDKGKVTFLHLVDTVTKDDRGRITSISTHGEYAREAECPYKPHTYAAKEWQRGYNAAYFNNIERNKNVGHSRSNADYRARTHKQSTATRPSGRR